MVPPSAHSFFFLCGKHHQGCIAPNADINLQSGRFCATVIASSRERLLDLRSCWIVFIHVVRGRPGGFLQFSKGEAVMVLLASVSSGILAIWPNGERRHASTIRQAWLPGCPSHLVIPHDLEYISLGDCPVLRAIQEDRQNAGVIQYQLGWNGDS